jgi:hypothetical protein
VGRPGRRPADQSRRRTRRVQRSGAPASGRRLPGQYLTKTTEDFGIPALVDHPRAARQAGASPHAQRIIDTAYTLALNGGDHYGRLHDRFATLGYRGHPITKSRHYSTTFGALRRSRATWRRRPARLAENAEIRELLDDIDDAEDADELVVKVWHYAGRGYLDLATAAAAVASAVRSRTRAAATTAI